MVFFFHIFINSSLCQFVREYFRVLITFPYSGNHMTERNSMPSVFLSSAPERNGAPAWATH